jgi:hypothetical protein
VLVSLRSAAVAGVISIAGFLTAATASSAVGQDRDPLRSRIPRPVFAVIRIPTVIAIGDTTRLAPRFGAVRATVDSLGFALQAFGRPVKQVVDQAHHAVHFVSSNLALGYLIIVPGRRPVAVYGPVNPDSLRSRVLAYLRINRELETGGL